MKLHNLKIIKSETCDGLLDGLDIPFHDGQVDFLSFSPLCLIGPNGSGKSQVLQIIAEIFQMIFAKYLIHEERGKPGEVIEFVIDYSIIANKNLPVRVKISRLKIGRKKAVIKVEQIIDGVWSEISDTVNIKHLLPSKIIGYTSGENETLSIPFLVSRAGYASELAIQAFDTKKQHGIIKEPRLMLIDYGTNLEVLLANLLLNPGPVSKSLLSELNLKSLRSFRCVIQLNHAQAPKGGIRLTKELQGYVDALVSCASKKEIDKAKGVYELTFFVTAATLQAFQHYWKDGAIQLYSSFHKLAMLNELIIPKSARQAFNGGHKSRKFASKPLEPFEEHKVFRIESVEFISAKTNKPVDYVSLSDGEHQLAQLLGVACMACDKNTLFLLDEPESHFNPKWRIEFISKLIMQQTVNGKRKDNRLAAMQDCLITTHSPFVPSDLKKEKVLIFSKSDESGNVSIRRPQIETFGSKFDAILAECFGVTPAISGITRDLVVELLKNGSIEEITKSISELGESSARMKLAAKLAMLEAET